MEKSVNLSSNQQQSESSISAAGEISERFHLLHLYNTGLFKIILEVLSFLIQSSVCFEAIANSYLQCAV